MSRFHNKSPQLGNIYPTDASIGVNGVETYSARQDNRKPSGQAGLHNETNLKRFPPDQVGAYTGGRGARTVGGWPAQQEGRSATSGVAPGPPSYVGPADQEDADQEDRIGRAARRLPLCLVLRFPAGKAAGWGAGALGRRPGVPR